MYDDFGKQYRDIKVQNSVIDLINKGLAYEDNYEEVSEKKRLELISTFNQTFGDFVKKYETFLSNIGCSIETYNEQKEGGGGISIKKQLRLALDNPHKFVDFLHSNEYEESLKSDIRPLVYLYVSDQIENNYKEYVQNGFLDIFKYRNDIFGNKYKHLNDLIESARKGYLNEQVQINELNFLGNGLDNSNILWHLNLDIKTDYFRKIVESNLLILRNIRGKISDKEYIKNKNNVLRRLKNVQKTIEQTLKIGETPRTHSLTPRKKQKEFLGKNRIAVKEYLIMIERDY